MDRITKSLLDAFLRENKIDPEAESSDFEKFANYCVVFREYSDIFDVQDVCVGATSDTGIDGIAILVNGHLVETEEEIDDLINANRYLDATFVFVQAKSGGTFEGTEISNFFLGVREFFSDRPRLPRNEFIQRKSDLSSHIYSNSSRMVRRKPVLKMYYVTTGSWIGDTHLQSRIDIEIDQLKSMEIFSTPVFEPVGASQLQALYRATAERASAEITFRDKITLPDIQGISQSFIGILPIDEFLKLIVDVHGNIIKQVFYDNVRDYQGDNPVNTEIAQTLTSEDAPKLVVFNNGITIVAESLTVVANRFTLRDYQIVNGCQTSHVIASNRDKIDQPIFIPVRLIEVKNDSVINKIIKSTNRQTAVKEEQLIALSEFQKSLEIYYSTFSDPSRLFYERRSRQYRDDLSIEKVRVVTVSMQIKAFASMFLDEPHRAGRYYGTLIDTIGNRIFGSDHDPIPYFVSALAYYKLEFMFRNRLLDYNYRKFRYHILMILRYRIGGTELPRFNNHRKITAYCEKIINVLTDDQLLKKEIQNVIDLLDVVGVDYADYSDRDTAKTQAFTSSILDLMRQGPPM